MKQANNAEEAIKIFAKTHIEQGYTIQALHQYYNYDGTESHIRARLIHNEQPKVIRPLYKTPDGTWKLGEPPHLKNTRKPIYSSELLLKYPGAVVLIVEGEYPTDILNNFFHAHGLLEKYVAVTSVSVQAHTHFNSPAFPASY